jgi:tetratricopeptide (TPR) repeat protein
VNADDTETERTAALDRLFHYFRHTAASAVGRYAPKVRGQIAAPSAPATPIPAFDDRQQATAWLDAERANLLATAVHAADHGSAQHTGDLSDILYMYLRTAGHDHEAEGLHDLAVRVASRADRARAMTRLGYTQVRLGRQAEAATTLERALSCSHDAGDPADEARVLMGLGRLYEHMGRLVDAVDCTRDALDIARDLGDRGREATARINLGSSLLLLGRYDDALDHLATALVITRENEDLHDECVVRGNLAEIARRLGDDDQSLEQLRRVLSIARSVGFREGETKALSGLGTVLAQAGRHQEALAHHREAIAIAREIGLRNLEVEALNDLGNTLRRHGQVRRALECHDEALNLAGADAESFQLARTHEGLGDDHRDLGDHDLATEHWRQALAVYDRMGTPEADDVRSRLTADPPS